MRPVAQARGRSPCQRWLPSWARHISDGHSQNGSTGMDITARGTIDHPIDAVWEVLRDFAGLKAWHPQLLTCETEGTGIGAVRRVTLKDGRGAAERLEVLDADRHVLAYSVVDAVRQ